MIVCVAPVVKWISHRSSEPLLWVRILPGAQAAEKAHFMSFWAGFENLEYIAERYERCTAPVRRESVD